MKKLILILAIATTFFSCEAEEVTSNTCECVKETWLRYNGGAWYHNGATSFYSNDCSDDGDIINGHSGQGYDFQYRINCN
jgi:hypothetical protein